MTDPLSQATSALIDFMATEQTLASLLDGKLGFAEEMHFDQNEAFYRSQAFSLLCRTDLTDLWEQGQDHPLVDEIAGMLAARAVEWRRLQDMGALKLVEQRAKRKAPAEPDEAFLRHLDTPSNGGWLASDLYLIGRNMVDDVPAFDAWAKDVGRDRYKRGKNADPFSEERDRV